MPDILRVLYVDDDPSLLDIGKVFLEDSGEFTVTTSLSAAEGIQLLEQASLDAVVSDYQMPGMDGIQFLVEVRSRFGPIPFILFTGRGREEVVIQAINSGANFYLQKGGEPEAQFAELAHKIKAAASSKRADDALRKSEARYRNIVEDQTELISRFTPDGSHAFVNEAYCRYFGLKREDILGQRFRPKIPDEDMERVQKFLASLTPEHTVGSIEHRIVMPDGQVRWQRWSDRAIFDDSGTLIEYQSVGRDITEKKQAEDERTEYQTRLKEVIEFLPDATLAIDRQKRIIVWNKAIEQMTGIPAAEMIGKGDHAYSLPFYGEARPQLMDLVFGDSEEIAARYPAIRREGDALIAEVFCNALYNNRGAWVFAKASPLYDSIGNIVGAIESIRDITGHRRAEEALRESEVTFKALTDDANDGILVAVTAENHTYANRRAGEILGYTVAEFLKCGIKDLAAPDKAEELLKNFSKRLTGEDAPKRYETSLRHKDGTIIPVEISAAKTLWHGQPADLIIIHDITKRKQAEEALRENEVRFRTLFQDAADAHLLLVNGIYTDCNQALLTLMRCTREEIIGHSPIELSPEFQPDGLRSEEKAAVLIREVFETGSKRFEWMHRRPDGTCFWAEVVGTSLIIDGKPTLFGSWRDITERKQAEEALLNNTEELHAANEQLTAVEEELKSQFDSLSESEGRVRKKLESLLSPGGDIGMLDLGDIIDPQVLQRLMEDFTRVTGMATAILDTKGTVLVATGWQEICTKFHRVNPVTAGFCTESDLHLAKNMKQGEYVAYHCKNHLWDVVTPLYIGSKHMGNIFTGQFFYDDDIVDESVFIRQAEKYGFDRDAYVAALHRVPKFSRQKISDLMDYLVKLTDFISLLSYRNLELARTVTERDTLLTSLQKSEGKFRTLVENIPQKIFLKDLDSRYVTVNENFARDLGMSPDEMAGKTDADLFPAEFAASYRAGDIRVLETGKTDELEERYLLDGKETWVHTIKTVVKDEDGAVAGLLGVFWDITDRKRAEEALKTSEQDLKEAQAIAQMGRWELDLVHNTLHWSEGIYQIFEINPEEFRATYEAFLACIHPDDRDAVNVAYTDSLDTKKTYEIVHRLLMKDGRIKWVNEICHTEYDSKGQPLRSVGIVQDITTIKVAEEALRVSEQKFRVIANYTVNWESWFGAEGKYMWVSPSVAQFTGYSDVEILAMPDFISTVIAEEDRPLFTERFREAISGTRGENFEFRYLHRNGTKHWLNVSWQPIFDMNGNSLGTRASGHDITDRKRAEETLKESEEFNRTLIENLPDYIIVYRPDGKILYVNPATVKGFGYNLNEFVGTSVISYVAPECRTRVTATIATRLKGDDTPEYETVLITKEGQRKTVIAKGTLVHYHDGLATLLLLTDITERKEAERVLLESEEKYRVIFNNDIYAICIFDLDTLKLLDVNDAYTKLYGYSRNELLSGMTVHDITAEHEASDSATGEAINCGTIFIPLRYHKKKDSTIFPVEIVGGPYLWNGKKVMFALTHDITKRKNAEEKLRKSEAKYRQLIELAQEGIWAIDADGNTTYVNQQMAKILGYNAEEMLGVHLFSFMDDTGKIIAAANMERRRQGIKENHEFEFITKGGNRIYAHLSTSPIIDEKGVYLGALAVVTDITERKRVEEALNLANKKLTLLTSISRHDINNQLTVMQGYLNILGKKQSDPVQKDYLQKAGASAQRISSMIRFTKEYENIGIKSPVWHDCRTIVEIAAKETPLGKVTINNDFPAGTEVFADPLIVKVCYNLIDNALRHGGKITTIRFSVEERDGDHVIVCEDDGDGIPSEEKEKIFERGFGNNTGMGLFLSRDILSITGITICETGIPGKGARFELTVPKGMYR